MKKTSMAGARYFETTALRPDCAIIGEPTSLQRNRYARTKGASNVVRVTGQSGHSSDPARGVSAIELMHDAVAISTTA